MAKKEKEVCPYCGKAFIYLSRHKCKVKERMESVEDESTQKERRQERVEERKKELTRTLNKDEKQILEIIDRKEDIIFEELIQLVDIERNKLDEMIDLLALRGKIKVRRELINASWSKHIFSIEDLEDQIEVEEVKINERTPDWVWRAFQRQPCFTCPFTEQCSEDNPDIYNPNHCPWLTEWISASLAGEEYEANFEV